MTKLQETNQLFNEIKKQATGGNELSHEAVMTALLADIGKSLAILADGLSEDIPTAEWIVKHGELFMCSRCKNIFEEDTDFCPDCGARMRKGG